MDSIPTSFLKISRGPSMSTFSSDSTIEIDDIGDTDLLLKKDEGIALKLPSSHAMEYRPDIDGLRTVAIVPVLIFHAYPELFPSGFVGVDVFFVISGYLISGILLKEMAQNSFTYMDFYSRRIRRIYPTLLVMLVSTWWTGCLYLMADQLKKLAATMLAGTLFSANLQVLSLKASYFDSSVQENPLLHLWSLGVEEQFYIFWPMFMGMITKLPFNKAVKAQVVVAGASFLLNLVCLGFADSNKVSFYMPLCRFWQMAVGGFLAFCHFTMKNGSMPVEYHTQMTSMQSSFTTWGICLLLLGFFLISEDRAFPGTWALLPTLGAVLLIAGGPSSTFHTKVLSNDAMIYIGKISYALYLWHWPLLVFAKVRYPNPDIRPFYMQPWVMMLAAFVLAISSYDSIELPMRTKYGKAKHTVAILFGLMTLTTILSLCTYTMSETMSVAQREVNELIAAESSQDFISPVADPINTDTLNSNVSIQSTNNHKHPQKVNLKDSNNTFEAGKTQVPNEAKQTSNKFAQTTLAMVQLAKNDAYWDWNMDNYTCPEDSPYITQATWKKTIQLQGNLAHPYYPERCKIINPQNDTKNGLLIVLGDSHSDMTKPRYLQLYKDSVKGSKAFPTIVFKARYGRPMLPCRPEYYENINMVKTLKPQAVLITMHFIQYLNPGAPADWKYVAPPQCCQLDSGKCKYQSVEDVNDNLKAFGEHLKELVDLGIKVFVIDQRPEAPSQNPVSWINGNRVVVPPPLSRSDYVKEHKWLFEPLHAAISKANATIIDLADNFSDGDKILQVNPDGYPVMSYNNHISTHTVRNFITVLDQTIEAARK